MAERGLSAVVDLIGKMVRTEGVAGAGVAVLSGGELVLEHYAGLAAPGQPASASTLWPLASISKLYTATAIMVAVERGDLTLSTRVKTVLPRMDGGGREHVTLRQLLTHTAGLIYESPEMPKLLESHRSLGEIVDEVYERPLLYQPGTDQLYSDLGFALAGRLLAATLRRDFPVLVRELVLEPARLHDTHMPPDEGLEDRFAYVAGSFAEGTDGAMYNSPYARGLAHPAFGTLASLRDLLRFGKLFTPHAETPLLSPITLRTMITDQTGGDFPGERVMKPGGVNHPWGVGFFIKGRAGTPELVSPLSFGHAGASGCILWIDPVSDVVIAFVSNRHYNLDPDGFFSRLDRVVNVAMAACTRA